MYNADEHNQKLAEQDEKWGMGRLSDDTIQNPGGLRSELLKLAATSRDAQEVLAAEGIELPTVPKKFRLSQSEIGTIVADTKGLWTASIVVDGQTLTFQSEDRDFAMMSAERYLEKNRGPRDLTSSEALKVARLAQSGESAQAIELYVALRLNGKDHRSAEDILTDPALTGLLNDAARYVWSYTRPDWSPSPAFDELLDRISATRVMTVNSIDILFDRFQEQQAGAARAPRQAAPQAAATPENARQPAQSAEEIQNELEHLDDAALEKLRMQTLKHRGNAIRRFDQRMGAR
jgi:hypothetical protein